MRYYWLKFQKDFFTSKRIKKLRSLAGGDTFTIIYLKMQLKAIETEGILEYTGLEKTFAEEIALDIDESPDNVGITINYLLNCGLMEIVDDTHIRMPFVLENIGSEGASAQRMRDFRTRQASLCDTGVTESDISVTESKRKSKSKKQIESKTFTPPSVDEVRAYCKERGNSVDPETFVDFYSSKGWMVGKNRMKDWKACVRTWERSRDAKPEPKSGKDYNAMVMEELLSEL